MSLPANANEYLSKDAIANITTWLNEPKYQEYRDELQQMIDHENWKELEDSFFKVIEFGTGGRRGTTGVGSNRINRVTIGESAQALCEYAHETDSSAIEKGVVIAYDTRLSSPELSRYAAQVCAANGFKTYLFDSFRSTPELSFAVRHLKTAIGIVISASHNPPADNGFKAYWSDGGQLVAPHDKGVMAKAQAISEIKSVDFDEAVDTGAIAIIGEEIDEAYIKAVTSESESANRDIKIVYSPLHGAGQTNVLPTLRYAGFNDIVLVDEQMVPDGNFPTIENGKPNPEEKSANDMAVKLLLESRADIAITNDPDADRIGVIARRDDEAMYLNGNQAAVLVADYVLRQKLTKNELTSQHYIAKTIVTTDMLQALADAYQVKLYGNMLVGFKYIGELILAKESTDEIFLLGGEESYGLLKGEYARDKDGAVGALVLAESAAELKVQGKTLYDRLLELYREHGLYAEYLTTMVCQGADGFEKMQRIMQALREHTPRQIGKHDVTHAIDYAVLERCELASNAVEVVDCIKGNVFVLEFGDSRCRITVRPSGTEPKLKFYVQWCEPAVSNKDTEEQLMAVQGELKKLASELEKALLDLIA